VEPYLHISETSNNRKFFPLQVAHDTQGLGEEGM